MYVNETKRVESLLLGLLMLLIKILLKIKEKQTTKFSLNARSTLQCLARKITFVVNIFKKN